MRHSLIISLLLAITIMVNGQSIISSSHNLSINGQDSKSIGSSGVCSYCHMPHNEKNESPIWKSVEKERVYTLYNSSTMQALPGQPDGSSILCLSCHDGTIASRNSFTGAATFDVTSRSALTAGTGNLGTDLRNDHPISFVYSSSIAAMDGQLKNPMQLNPETKLENGKLQCTSCHDPHKNINSDFLVTTTQNSNLCNNCHQRTNWTASSHNTSNKTWNNISPNPWPFTPWKTVAENACENCHNPHNSKSITRLLKYQQEENNCFDCHNGNVATKNLQAEFNKTYKHNVFAYQDIHDPAEQASLTNKHVECADCHNAHASKAMAAEAPAVKGANIDVIGINQTGAAVKSVADEYEICYRCHSNNAVTISPTARLIEQNNVRLEFASGNPSYHAVAATGTNSNVPSLISPLTTTSRIYCTDCHGNNNPNGPKGPHGSIYPQILKAQYVRQDNMPYNVSNYELCFKCHSSQSIMADQSFKKHKMHIDDQKTSCNVCHDPHGISSTQGNSTNNSNLINFNTAVVSKASNGMFKFEDLGLNSGRCFLMCHGKNHNGLSY